MLSFKSLALVLVIAGGMVLAYGRYNYQPEGVSAAALANADPRAINSMMWVGIATMAVGLSLFLGMRSR